MKKREREDQGFERNERRRITITDPGLQGALDLSLNPLNCLAGFLLDHVALLLVPVVYRVLVNGKALGGIFLVWSCPGPNFTCLIIYPQLLLQIWAGA